MEESTIVGLAGLAVGAAVGLLTSAMSYLWVYKTRAYPHREFLYQRQIDEYVELSAALSRTLYPCHDFLFGREMTPENRKELQILLDKAYDGLQEQFRKSLAILPVDVAFAVNQLFGKLSTEIPNLDNTRQIIDSLLNAEMEIYSAIRKNAGIGPLTEEMLRAFGQR